MRLCNIDVQKADTPTVCTSGLNVFFLPSNIQNDWWYSPSSKTNASIIPNGTFQSV